MNDFSRKIPTYDGINSSAVGRAIDEIHKRGKSLPCSVVSVSGSIVTIKFEVQTGYTLPNVQVPVATSAYERVPVQVGDKGAAIAVDAYLGAISGLGQGIASLTQRGNLTTLFFQPLGSASWSSVDGTLYVLQGPNGTLMQSMDGSTSFLIDKRNGIKAVTDGKDISLSNGTASLAITGGDVKVTGTFSINGIEFMAHTHTNGNEGSPTGGVIG